MNQMKTKLNLKDKAIMKFVFDKKVVKNENPVYLIPRGALYLFFFFF